MLSVVTAGLSFTAPLAPAAATTRCDSVVCGAIDRRAALGGLIGAAAALAAPLQASAQIESVNPGNNYYFPMAKYRYLPRIFRAWVAIDELAPAAIEVGDWDGLEEVWRRADDAITAMPLYTNAVEGSRSTKRKKKSPEQKQMTASLKVYTGELEKLEKAVKKKDKAAAQASLAVARDNLLTYRQLAQIDGPDGGVISLPLGNAEEAGHAGAPLGYVIPAFRGGGVSMDYALRPGEAPMMKNGIITQEYRDKFQNADAAGKDAKRK